MFTNIFKRSDGTESKVRVVKGEDGEPLFVLADVAKALGYSGGSKPKKHLRDSQFRVPERHTYPELAGRGSMPTLITEGGVYRLIMKSEAPDADAFQDWVTDEVLPSIRKTGSYQTDDPLAAFPDYVRDAFLRMAEENKVLKVEVQELTEEVAELSPLAEKFKEFTDSSDSASCRDVSRLLNMPERQFTGLLREWGWIEKWGTAATAKSRTHGWMVNKVITAKYGARPVQGRITSKGFETLTKKVSAV